MKHLSEIRTLIQQALELPPFLRKKLSLDLNSFSEILKCIDFLEHQIYSAIEDVLSHYEISIPFHEQKSLLKKIGTLHSTQTKLEEAHALTMESFLADRSGNIWVDQFDSTLFRNPADVSTMFFKFYDTILNFTQVNDQDKPYLCSSIFKLMSRPAGQNIINMLITAAEKHKLTITFAEDTFYGRYATSSSDDLEKDPKDYYLKEDNIPGSDVTSVKIDFPPDMHNQISIVIAHNKKNNKATFSFQPPFLSLGHELYHAVSIFTGTSRAKLKTGFNLNQPENRLYPDPEDAEEIWVIESGRFSENHLRDEHFMLRRVGHEGKPLQIQWETAKLPLDAQGIYYSSALVTALAMEKLLLNDLNFKGYWLKGANFRNLFCDNINFQQATLEDAEFTQTNLQYADFTYANVKFACFERANLIKACFRNADLTNANLNHADLTDTDLTNATLENVNLIGAVLNGVKFSADLDLTKIIKYNLTLIENSSASISVKQKYAQQLIVNIVSQINHPPQLALLLNDMLNNSGLLLQLKYTLSRTEKSPYKLLRQETGYMRLSYGNTAPWNQAITKIKDQYLQCIADNSTNYEMDKTTYHNMQKLLAIRSDRNAASFFFADSRAEKFDNMKVETEQSSTIKFKKAS